MGAKEKKRFFSQQGHSVPKGMLQHNHDNSKTAQM
jgi:hypothetical protein